METLSPVSGKYNVFKALGIDEEFFREIVQKERTCAAAAKKLGITRTTCLKWIKILKVERPGKLLRSEDRSLHLKNDSSKIAKWAKAHPGEKLPARITDIAKTVGCSQAAASMYFSRRSSRVVQWAKNLGDWRTLPGSVLDTSGRHIPWRLANEIDFFASGRTLMLTLHVWITPYQYVEIKLTPRKAAELWNQSGAAGNVPTA